MRAPHIIDSDFQLVEELAEITNEARDPDFESQAAHPHAASVGIRKKLLGGSGILKIQ
jgi:hypothetical protein